MKVKDLISHLSNFDDDMLVVGYISEFATYYPVNEPRVVKLVKGNMYCSDNGEEWVEKHEDMRAPYDNPVKITEETDAVRVF